MINQQDTITIEEVQKYIGALWLENRMQAKRIEELEDIIAELAEQLKSQAKMPPVKTS